MGQILLISEKIIAVVKKYLNLNNILTFLVSKAIKLFVYNKEIKVFH